MFQHFQHCETVLEIMTLYQLPDMDTEVSTVNVLSTHIADIIVSIAVSLFLIFLPSYSV